MRVGYQTSLAFLLQQASKMLIKIVDMTRRRDGTLQLQDGRTQEMRLLPLYVCVSERERVLLLPLSLSQFVCSSNSVSALSLSLSFSFLSLLSSTKIWSVKLRCGVDENGKSRMSE